MGKNRLRKTITFLFFIIIFLGLRTCYYGSPIRSCIYTEEEIPLAAKIKNSKIYLVKPVVVAVEAAPEYSCLSEMGTISNQLVETKYAYIFKERDQRTISPSDEIVLEPVKLIAVTKHGITTIDSGSGPIDHLILKDSKGVLYQVATVSLGLNKGDEFLKAVAGEEEFTLNPDTEFRE